MSSNLLSRPRPEDAPWLWRLDDRQAATLLPAAAPRWLHVEDGCVWITARLSGPDAEDLWLTAGQTLALPAGSAWVIEAWPQARLSLRVAAPAAAVSARPAAGLPWMQHFLGWLATRRAPRSA